jgi:U3 small nucleolar RNA-associated protein 13
MMGKIAAGNEEIEDQFSSFDIDPTEKMVLTVSRKSGLIKIHDIAESKEITSWKCAHQLPVLDVAYSPTGMEVASCSADKSIVVYSVKRSGVVTHRFAPSATNPSQKPGHKSRVVHIFWHPSPKRMELVSCAEDGEMRIWKLSDSSSVLLANHMSLVTSVAFSKDGNTLISGGRDKVVNVWSIAPQTYGHHLRTLPVYESVEGLSILSARPSCLPKGEHTAADTFFTTAGSKGQLRTWSLNTLDCVYTKDLPTAAATEDSNAQSQINAGKYIANQVAHLLRIPAKKADNTEERLIAVTQEQNFCTRQTDAQ